MNNIYLKELAEKLSNLNVYDDDQFRLLLNETLSCIDLTSHLSHNLGISRPTVGRWVRGDSSPHPAVRQPVIDLLIKSIAAHLESATDQRKV